MYIVAKHLSLGSTGARKVISILRKKLTIGGVETNPGPDSTSTIAEDPRHTESLSTMNGGYTANISMVHINAQSLRYKIDELEVESEDADVIAVTETWLEPKIITENLEIPSFHKPLRKDRSTDAHGGVAIYCRENHIIKERKDLHIPDLEALWAEILVGGKKLLVGAFYRPPNAPVEY
jgi:hypothetical protein